MLTATCSMYHSTLMKLTLHSYLCSQPSVTQQSLQYVLQYPEGSYAHRPINNVPKTHTTRRNDKSVDPAHSS